MDENPTMTQTQVNASPVEAQTTQTVNPTTTPTVGNKPNERRYSRDEVTSMMRKRVERSHRNFFTRYGVTDLKGLDDLFENSKRFSQMNDEFGKIQLRNSELMRENAFLKNNINPDKYDDIIAHFKGNNVDFSEDELVKALINHPEWLKAQGPATTTIKTMGAESHLITKPDDASRASKLLGVKF